MSKSSHFLSKTFSSEAVFTRCRTSASQPIPSDVYMCFNSLPVSNPLRRVKLGQTEIMHLRAGKFPMPFPLPSSNLQPQSQTVRTSNPTSRLHNGFMLRIGFFQKSLAEGEQCMSTGIIGNFIALSGPKQGCCPSFPDAPTTNNRSIF